jgi:hypothetical protein
MKRVYVINGMNHDFASAEKHGTITYVTEGKVPIFKTDIVKGMLQKGLADFDITKDFLLVSGPAILCMMSALIVAKPGTPIKTLVFDAKEQDYVVRHISI